MAIKNVTATRMTLLELKNQVKVASRGHKLLKDKQDGLMKTFLEIVRAAKDLRGQVEGALKEANASFLEAQAIMPKSFMLNALAVPTQKVSLEVTTRNVMSVKIPDFVLHTEGHPFGYGMNQTRGELDIAIKKFSEVFELMIRMAEIEKQAENLALEIEKTRRRVNALEHRLIPDLEDTLRYVKLQLGEAERAGIVQIMAIKNMIEESDKKKAKEKEKIKQNA
jgi:V/A-type H+-transporting ATPase subunit D